MTNPVYVTNVQAKMMVLHGVVEISWVPPLHPDFKEVLVFRKVNDFVRTELDPYATLVYQGSESKVYDYQGTGGGSTSLKEVTQKVIGTYNFNTMEFENKVANPLRGETLYYYTVFTVTHSGQVYSSQATMDTSRVNHNQGMADLLYSYLPANTKLQDKRHQLKRYLMSMGMVYDFIKTSIDNMRHFIDIDTCEPYQLNHLAYLIDWELDQTLSVPSQRQSLKTAIDVYRNAGTKKGLDTLVKNNSGFPTTSGVTEGRESMVMSMYFGYLPTDAVLYDYEATPNFTTLDPLLIGKPGDPLKYTADFSANAQASTDSFLAYVRKTSVLTPEQESIMRERLERLLTRFAPAGTKFEIDIY